MFAAAAAQSTESMPGSFGEALAHALFGTPGSAQRVKQPDQTPSEVSRPEQGAVIPVAASAAKHKLSDEFYVSQTTAIAKYNSWQTAAITFQTVAFQNGSFLVSWQETPDTYQAEQNARLKRMDSGQGGWASWNALGNPANNPYENIWTITCIFPANAGKALSAIQSGAARFGQIKIKSATGHQLIFDCHL